MLVLLRRGAVTITEFSDLYTHMGIRIRAAGRGGALADRASAEAEAAARRTAAKRG